MTELTNVADAIEYRCGECGEPVAMAQLWVDDTGHPYHLVDAPNRWAAQLHLHQRGDSMIDYRISAGLPMPPEGSWLSVFVQLHEDDRMAADAWCWRCGSHFTLDVAECRREVAMTATSPNERGVRIRRLKKVSQRR